MRFSASVAGLFVLSGCIDFGAAQVAFCDNVAPEHRLAACPDHLGPEPAGLSIADLPESAVVSACSGAVWIKSVGGSGEQAVVRTETLVALSGTPSFGVAFFSDEVCATSVSAVTMPAGGDDVSFAFKNSTVGPFRIEAYAQGLAGGAGEVEIVRGDSDGLVFLTGPRSTVAGGCSAPVTVQFQRSDGSPIQFSSEVQVGLFSDAARGVTFFSDPGCSSPIASLHFGAGQNSATLHFKMTVAGPFSIAVSAAGMAGATQTETVSAGPPSKLALVSPPQSTIAGACSGAVTVQSQDVHGNATAIASGARLSLSSSPPPGVSFYADDACTQGITEALIEAGAASASFYFKGTVAGVKVINVAATGLSGASQPGAIRPATASKLALTGVSSALTAGACSGAVTVELRDALDNVAVAPESIPVTLGTSGPSPIVFSANADCTGTIQGVTIGAGQSAASFYFKNTKAGPVTIAASSGYGSGRADLSIVPASPSQIRFTSSIQSAPRGAVVGPMTFAIQDVHGNDSPLFELTGVEVTVEAQIGIQYFCSTRDACSNSGCCTCACGCGCTGDYVFLPAGEASGSFWFRNTQPDLTELTIRVTLPGVGLVSDAQIVSITL